MVRLDGEYLPVARDRLSMAAERLQSDARVVVRVRVIGTRRNGAAKARERPLGIVRRQQHPKTVMRLGIVGPQGDRALEGLARLGEAAENLQRAPQVIVGVR